MTRMTRMIRTTQFPAQSVRPVRRILSRILPVAGLSFALALFLSCSSTMHAQDNSSAPPPQSDNATPQPGQQGQMRHHRPSAERQVKRMTRTLNLTSDQQQQILPILQNRNQQMRALWSNSSLSPQDRHTQMRSLSDASNQKVEAVLTDTQKQQYEAMLAKNRQRMEEHRQHMQQPNSTPPPDSSQPNPPSDSAPPSQ